MCSLFGFIDYQNCLNARLKSAITNVLATTCEARGADAAGVAYNSDNALHIYKCPKPAHQLTFHIPSSTSAVMGHTRLATQGSAKHNRNNHPFSGKTGETKFALAHNGVLENDADLRIKEQLPVTNIETDSYVAVQLLQKYGSLSIENVRKMAEALEGSFTFTLLDDRDNLVIIRGTNPFCLYDMGGFYLYASTEQLLDTALQRLHIPKHNAKNIPLYCGDILTISKEGRLSKEPFELMGFWMLSRNPLTYRINARMRSQRRRSWQDDLHMTARNLGIHPEDIDLLLEFGYRMEEVEELLSEPREIYQALDELYTEGWQ